jgi:hypothetical protein
VAEALAVIARADAIAEAAPSAEGADVQPAPGAAMNAPVSTGREGAESTPANGASPQLFAAVLSELGSAPTGGSAFALGAEVELEKRWSSKASGSVRLGYELGLPAVNDHVRSVRHTVPLSVCPWAPRLSAALFVGPCANIRVGWFDANGDGVFNAESHTLVWLESGGTARLGLDTDFARISVELGLFIPLVRHHLFFGDSSSPSSDRTPPPVGFRGGIALALPIL